MVKKYDFSQAAEKEPSQGHPHATRNLNTWLWLIQENRAKEIILKNNITFTPNQFDPRHVTASDKKSETKANIKDIVITFAWKRNDKQYAFPLNMHQDEDTFNEELSKLFGIPVKNRKDTVNF